MTATIFAKASGAGRAGVSVFRLSGPDAQRALEALCGRCPRPRYAARVTLTGADGATIDDGLALWFPGPRSFTGEDVAELHVHGSLAVEVALGHELARLGLEPAGPGAFTFRAFANGKMDLTQVEGLADLLAAESALQHRQAMDQYGGRLRDQADLWRDHLIKALARLDAAVDFPDEDDVPAAIAEGAAPFVREVREGLEKALAGSRRARRLADGVTVAFVGPPNVGKSSLFNALVGDSRAIVSDEAGTTRDLVVHRVDFRGHLVSFVDMAGMRDAAGSKVEAEGIGRAEKAAIAADLRLFCWPSNAGDPPAWFSRFRRPEDLMVRTKADLDPDAPADAVSMHRPGSLRALEDCLEARLRSVAAPGLAPTQRQAALLAAASSELERFEGAASSAPELGAETIRAAARRLEELTGRIAPDDILADIFASFCIGK